MKEFKCLIIAFIVGFVLNIDAYAASGSLSVSSDSVYVGDDFTVTVNVNAAAWNIHVSSTGPVEGCSIEQVDASSDALDASKSFSATCKATDTGTITVTLKGDITGAEDDNATDLSSSKSVTVTEKPAPQPVNPQPVNPKPVVEEKKMKITKFEITGYEIDFDESVTEYTLEVPSDTESLNIVVEGENFTVTGDKEVSIVDKDEINVVLSNEKESKTYTIKINRKKEEKPAPEPTVVEKDSKKNNTLIYSAVFLGLSTCIFILSIRYYLKKSHK